MSGEIPLNGFPQTRFKRSKRLPAELPLNLRRVHRVTEVVPRTIIYVGDELAVGVFRPWMKLVENAAERLHNRSVALFAAAAYVPPRARRCIVKDHVNCPAVIPHPEPVAHVEPRAVERNGFMREALADHSWNELLRMLPGPVVVGAVGNRHVHAVGASVGADH